MSLTQAAVRYGEAFQWPDRISSLIIDRLIDRTRRKLALVPAGADAAFAKAMAPLPIAINAAEANTQHYEIPARFFDLVLGPQRKYSCCLYDEDVHSLSEAEERALAVTAANAELADGQRILELGCGWGSLSLWMARHYPNARITSVSNSHSQREYISRIARMEGLENIAVITADMNGFLLPTEIDRVISIEMFEHMVNWRPLLESIKAALKPQGLLYLHVFNHRSVSYRFSIEDRHDWIAQHFFTGGIMPSRQLIKQFHDVFRLDQEWHWNGRNYEQTAHDWLINFDRNSAEIRLVLKQTYGEDAELWQRRWRLFFLATIRLFGHAGGEEWSVGHYRMKPVN